MIQRREFLLSAIQTLLAGCVSTKIRQPASGGRIAIVGAGLTGLTAARQLAKMGYQVQVLEARGRLGGRVYTGVGPSGRVFEWGANWVHGPTGNPLNPLLEGLGLRMQGTDVRDPILFESGRRIPVNRRDQIDGWLMETVRRMKSLQAGALELSLEALLQKVCGQKWLASHPAHRLAFYAKFEDSAGASADQMSAQRWDDDEEFGGGDFLVQGGLSRLVDRLAQGLDIEINREVVEVRHGHNDVEVIDSAGRSWRADHALITIPLGVLKTNAVKFSPALPEWKLRAIQSCGFGHYEKIFAHSNRSISSDADWIEFCQAGESAIPLVLNQDHGDVGASLIGLVSGASAIQWAQMPLPECRRLFQQQMQSCFGNIELSKHFWRSQWSVDPYARGSFSYFKLGERKEDRVNLGRSVGDRLHFAGEACQPDHIASMHAAVISGERAAVQIARRSVY